MRGAVLHAPGDVRLEVRDDPTIVEPTDAIIRLSATCVCGSDLWPTGASRPSKGSPRWVTSTSASSRRSAALSAQSSLVSS
jgi:threonine dehydrogenase-like Zn-dependent dehydrogenase